MLQILLLAILKILSLKRDIVDLENGNILLSEGLIQTITRNVYNCATGSCVSAGSESNPPTSGDPLTAFSNTGLAYNFYKNNFSRSSYNNTDAPINSYTNQASAANNAYWDPATETLNFGSNMTTVDIASHELTHAVTQYTAGLTYSNQSGAINEGMSDIFGSAVDNNWTIGEGSSVGVIRDMANPTTYSHPDRLFSSNYYCGTSDHGGVHKNSGIMNKAYYQMAKGGSFNGCTISGVGRSVANKILYRALTVYLSSASNYYALYTSIINACNDLYGSTSSTCIQTTKALQATEMDQQPLNNQSGALCLNIARRTPACITSSVTPTPTLGVSPSPTPGTSSSLSSITSPAPGSQLTSSTTTFSWTRTTGATSYYLYVGTTGIGSTNIASNPTTSTSMTIGNIPTTSSTVYVRLWTYLNSTWRYNDYTYRAGSSSPTPTPSSSTSCDGGFVNCANSAGSNYSCSGTKIYQGNTSKDNWCRTNGGAGSREYCWKCTASTATPTPSPAPTSTSCTITCYRDADGDGYGVNASTLTKQCSCSTGWSTKNTDCYDSNANARPNQTGYFTTNRGDGSYDYNCDGVAEKNYPKNTFGSAATATCFASPPSGTVNFTNDTACGSYGTFRLCYRWATTACGGTSTANGTSDSTGQSCPSYIAGNGWALVDGGNVQQQCK